VQAICGKKYSDSPRSRGDFPADEIASKLQLSIDLMMIRSVLGAESMRAGKKITINIPETPETQTTVQS
jgi:hypothetical protein